MQVFEPAVREGREWALPLNPDDYDAFLELDGASRVSTWRPIPMRLLTSDEHGRPLEASDFPWLGSHALIARETAASVVAKEFDGEVELLPLQCDGAVLFVLNVRQIVDALDIDRSILKHFSSGRIMTIDAPVFFGDRLAGVGIFKIPQMLRGPVYVTDEFVEAIGSHGLEGIGFRVVWDSSAA